MPNGRRTPPLLVWVALLGVALVGCGEEAVAPEVSTYVDEQALEVHRPDGSGPWPIVVLLHGAGRDRTDYRAFAQRLAARGVLVLNADWRVLASDFATAMGDVSCVVRYAKSRGAEFGGDPGAVVLVGHSTAGVYAGSVATGPEEHVGTCTEPASSWPEAVVIISPAQTPGGPPWPYSDLGENPGVEIALVHGIEDVVASPSRSERYREILLDAGYSTALHLVPGGHRDLVLLADVDGLSPPVDAADRTIEVILDLAGVPAGSETGTG